MIAAVQVLLAVAALSLAVDAANERVYYNIAHSTNTVPAVKWAISQGANAIEVDIIFKGSTPTRFTHPFPCDCICSTKGTVCQHAPCGSGQDAAELLQYVAKTDLALVVIDSKINPLSMDYGLRRDAGYNIVSLVEKHLFGQGYRGQVIIGVPSIRAANYLEAAIDELKKRTESRWMSKYYFTIDGEKNNIGGAVGRLQQLDTRNIVFGTGISACLLDNLSTSTVNAVVSKTSYKEIGMAYIWTIDSSSTMRKYVQSFGGIMTNRPAVAAHVIKEAGLKLATQKDSIPSAVALRPTPTHTCDCDYHWGGCAISRQAPPNMACKCVYRGLWSCRGHLAHCTDPNSPFCKTPSKTIYSCIQGGGDCDGYSRHACDCDYRNGGCVISKPPHSTMACKCFKKGLWTCKGSVTTCKDRSSRFCQQPDKYRETCIQGGGNCAGYGKAKTGLWFGR
ncbi:dermonecrotic toxin LarSicTox-alphaVII1-like [Tubulanus polymorphus]|uniref:dermonecrotic toxin LarSicTox-alphaVII1-like n=1 Tax=Tubulanus polymorphus TaxID=672921 RepID=UPI003DA476F0